MINESAGALCAQNAKRKKEEKNTTTPIEVSKFVKKHIFSHNERGYMDGENHNKKFGLMPRAHRRT